MTTFPSHTIRPSRQSHDDRIRRVLIECTHTLESDLNTGIQRVVRSIISEAWSLQRELGIHCVPVAIRQGQFHDVSRAWRQRYGPDDEGSDDSPTAAKQVGNVPAVSGPQQVRNRVALGANSVGENQDDGLIQYSSQDLLLLLDSSWHFPAWEAVADAVERGCAVGCVYYDLIPVDFPEFCDETLTWLFREWLDQAVRHVDFAVTISRTVCNSIQRYAQAARVREVNRMRGFDHFRLGADFSRQATCRDVRPQLREVFPSDDTSTAPYLTVGTMEPRKNHAYLLDAFESVWKQCPQAKLCIVGRIGWKVDKLLKRIRRHRRFGTSLFLFNDLNDSELQWCYQRAKAFVFPSVVEGFGLPIVEALHHGLRVMASDTPIHREVANDFCAYFDLQRPASLAGLVVDIEQNNNFPSVRAAASYDFTTWKQSCRELLTKCLTHAAAARRRTEPGNARPFHPSSLLLKRLDLQPAGPLPRRIRHRDLVRYDDRRFVEVAYRALLNRPMDAGAAYHLERLREGKSKTDTLLSIQKSAEARESGARVRGLSTRKVLRRLERIPVLGYLVSWLVCLATLPRQRIRQDRLHQRIMSLLTHMEETFNGNNQRLEKALARRAEVQPQDVQQKSCDPVQAANESALLRQFKLMEQTMQHLATHLRGADTDVRDLSARVDQLASRIEHRLEQMELDLADLSQETEFRTSADAA